MAADLRTLVDYCDTVLESGRFRDYCPNGLQVEGRPGVRRLATAVTANQGVIDAAIAWDADALLVHHGYFWKGEDERIVGMKQRRISALLGAGLSLIAYHLPLDAHPTMGNNAQLGTRLGLPVGEALDPTDPTSVGNIVALEGPVPLQELVGRVKGLTEREPLVVGDVSRQVKRVAWCTGAAQGYIDRAALAGADVYISGEISEPTVHSAQEQGIAYIAAGHHATERYGVQALGEHLAEKFGLEWTFLDFDNPV
jgi:dinuclear metal center YbgI/SA1388 family protein